MGSLDKWNQVRTGLLERQKKDHEQAEAGLVNCRKSAAAIPADPSIKCVSDMWGTCQGKVEFCTVFGTPVCEFHHQRLHVGKADPAKPQPPEHYFGAGPQIRMALQEGNLILYCKCGEPFYPSATSSHHEDGTVVQTFHCPNDHEMEVTVSYSFKGENNPLERHDPAGRTPELVASAPAKAPKHTSLRNFLRF